MGRLDGSRLQDPRPRQGRAHTHEGQREVHGAVRRWSEAHGPDRRLPRHRRGHHHR